MKEAACPPRGWLCPGGYSSRRADDDGLADPFDHRDPAPPSPPLPPPAPALRAAAAGQAQEQAPAARDGHGVPRRPHRALAASRHAKGTGVSHPPPQRGAAEEEEEEEEHE